MNTFTIRDIENLSGIKAHTLRIWEHRYNLITPKRKESNHRFYDNEDLKHILRISHLYHHGYKISKIAAMETGAMNDLLSTIHKDYSNTYFINQLLEASIDFDEDKFEDILNQALKKQDFEDVIIQVVYPYLQKIGLLWVTENVIPTQEHFTSNIIVRKIVMAIDALQDNKHSSFMPILLFTPENECHEIPLLYIQYLLKKYGKKTINFGINTSVEVIKFYCAARQVSRLHFHVITHLTNVTMDEYLERLAGNFPDIQIVMSGPCVEMVKKIPNNARLLRSQNEIASYAKE